VASRIWQATDFCTNVTTCTQTVTVVDTTPPAITCPTNISAKTVNPAGASISFAPSVSDACDAAPVVTCVPASGSVFGFGFTTVNCTAVDACGNSNGCSFTVNLQLRHTTNYVVGSGIPDGNLNGLASTKTVATYIGIITDLNVTLKTTGGYNGDLYAYLVHDTGFSVLLNRVGRRSGDSFGYGDAGMDVTLDDQSANGDIHLYRFTLNGSHAIPLAGELTNSWAPDGRSTDPSLVLDSDSRTDLLSSFNGVNPNGSWTLFIADLQTVDIATLDSWGLDICGLPPIPASITTQPVDVITACTSNATFSIAVAGTAPFTNQWFKDGVAIPGAAGLSLTLSNVHPSDAGAYSAIVCNMANCVTSSPALLHVRDTNAPVITACAGNVTNSADSM
jgi:subtilisin-like proprotein convertase family protein